MGFKRPRVRISALGPRRRGLCIVRDDVFVLKTPSLAHAVAPPFPMRPAQLGSHRMETDSDRLIRVFFCCFQEYAVYAIINEITEAAEERVLCPTDIINIYIVCRLHAKSSKDYLLVRKVPSKIWFHLLYRTQQAFMPYLILWISCVYMSEEPRISEIDSTRII